MAGKRTKREGLTSSLHKMRKQPMPDNLQHFIRCTEADGRVQWRHKTQRGKRGAPIEKAHAKELEQSYQRWIKEQSNKTAATQQQDDDPNIIVGRIIDGEFRYKRDTSGLWWTQEDQWISDMLRANLERKWCAQGRPIHIPSASVPPVQGAKESTGS